MNAETAKILCDITATFYRKNSESFSASRQSPWDGWKRCFDAMGQNFEEKIASPATTRILDLACGNLRFETFLETSLPDARFIFNAIDNCEELASEVLHARLGEGKRLQCPVHYQNIDVLDLLFSGGNLSSAIEFPACSLAVSFGFMHHIPLVSQREAVLSALVDHTSPGGIVAVSFWQFLNNKNLADKAHAAHEQAMAQLGLPPLDRGDFLLGWKNMPKVYRYCHAFDEVEIDRLAASLVPRATVADRFVSDGRSGNLNSYLVLRVN